MCGRQGVGWGFGFTYNLLYFKFMRGTGEYLRELCSNSRNKIPKILREILKEKRRCLK